jgi:hypothetical protein
MTLGEEQERFSLMLAKLIIRAYDLGYKIRMGEGYDDDGVGHTKGSTHYVKLGQDINLFKDGVYLTDGKDHNILHDYWDELGGAARIIKDLNHYSIMWQGVR